MAKVDKTDTCWLWTAGVGGRGGYGRFWISGHSEFAHRFSYELARGPIPEGLTLDHLCRNTKCVNPDHLEPVTLVENIMRGDGFSAKNARKTHCVNGHPFAGDNLIVTSKGRRACRTCGREFTARWRAANPRPPIERTQKLCCIRGHAFTDENTLHIQGGRRCRACHRMRQREYRQRIAA